MSECRHFYVHGRVQGVSFRASARHQAQGLRLSGWVRNCADGSVEALACGDSAALDSFRLWLEQGPPGARVTEVAMTAADAVPPSGFTIA